MIRNSFRAASLALMLIGLALSAGFADARPAMGGAAHAHSRRMHTKRFNAATTHSGGRSLLQTPGGPTPADPSSPAVVAAASWVVNAVNAPGSTITVPSLSGALVLLSIPVATQQVVNGMLYQLTLNCTDSAQHRIMLYPTVMAQRSPNGGGASYLLINMGGMVSFGDAPSRNGTGSDVSPVDPTALAVQQAAAWVVVLLGNPATTPLQLPSLVGTLALTNISTASANSTSGLLVLTLLCTDDAQHRITIGAAVLGAGSSFSLQAAWGTLAFTSVSSDPQRSAQTTPGGVTPAEPTSPAVQQAAAFAIAAANDPSSPTVVPFLSGTLTLANVTNATQQVAAGMVYGTTLAATDASGHVFKLIAKVWAPVASEGSSSTPSLVLESLSGSVTLVTPGPTGLGNATRADPTSPAVRAAAVFAVAQANAPAWAPKNGPLALVSVPLARQQTAADGSVVYDVVMVMADTRQNTLQGGAKVWVSAAAGTSTLLSFTFSSA